MNSKRIIKKQDLPITINKEDFEGPDENTEFICPHCHRTLVCIDKPQGEYYCKHDSIAFFPREDKNVRSVDKVDMPIDEEENETLAATIDNNDDYYSSTKYSRPVEIKVGFKALQDYWRNRLLMIFPQV